MSLISAFIAKAVSVEHSTVAWFTKEWQIIVKNEPKVEAITDTAVTYIGGCVQLALAGTGNTLLSAQVGNVDTGLRYMVPLFQMNTGYQTGFSNSGPIAVNVTQSGCTSSPTNWRSRILHARPVVPLPAHGSKTFSPGSEK